MPLIWRSFINSTGPGAVTLTKPVSGSPSVLGHVFSSVARPVIVTSSPCLSVSLENCTFENATVSIRKNPSCEFSPCAEAMAAVLSSAQAPRTRLRKIRCVIASGLPVSEALDEAADRPDGQIARNQLTDPVAGDRD